MKRILHITGTMDRAGAETMLMNLYREMDRSKIQFDFIFFAEKKGDYEEEINKLGGKVYRILANNPFKRTWALKKFLEKHPEYKIIHGHTLFGNAFHVFAAKLAGVPNRISHSHNTSIQVSNKFVASVYQYLSRLFMAKCSTQFISCGKEAAQFLFPKQKAVLNLPNSINIEEFARIGENKRDNINATFKLDDKTLKIIQVGRLEKVKNHKFSIAIAKRLKEEGIPLKMFFIGQGTLYREIESQIKKHDLTNEVILLGLRMDIPELMAGADVMLMPSLHEGFPVVLVESQAVGLPAVISNSIASEVDLGLGLLQFKDVEKSIDCWVAGLKNAKIKNKSSRERRVHLLRKKGFDVKANANKLTALYNSMS